MGTMTPRRAAFYSLKCIGVLCVVGGALGTVAGLYATAPVIGFIANLVFLFVAIWWLLMVEGDER
jgi:lipopolysaccharide export LptBFGC system permease protein LptF